MHALITVVVLFAGLFFQSIGLASDKTDFPVEYLGGINGMALPRTSDITTGAAAKTFANSIVPVETKWSDKTKLARKRFFHAVGELVEIADESDFVAMVKNFGYDVYSGENLSRTIDIAGFYNESTAPSLNSAVTRIFKFAQKHLEAAQSDLDSLLNLDWNGSFALDIEINLLVTKVKLFDKLMGMEEYYIDRGDVTLARGFIRGIEGALYLLHGYNLAMDYPTALAAAEKLLDDPMNCGMTPVAAFDASAFAHLKVSNVSDLQTAKTHFVAAFADFAAADALLKARTDGKTHLFSYSSTTIKWFVEAVLTHKDALLAALDQLISPVNLSAATVNTDSLSFVYTGSQQAPHIYSVTVKGEALPYELVGVTTAAEPGTYQWKLVGYGRTTGSKTIYWQIIVPPPSISGDDEAEIRADGQGGYIVTPSVNQGEVEITIPAGLAAENVTVEIAPTVKSVKLNGAAMRIVRSVGTLGTFDISDCLQIPAPDGQGTIDLTKAVVKPEIVREALDVQKDAVVNLTADEPCLTTAKTRPGLVYTLVEGTSIMQMGEGDSIVGDGQPWNPTITVKGGRSGFYFIRVTK